MERSDRTTPARRLWPWLSHASLALVALYAVLWRIDPYVYAAGVFAGGIAYFGTFTALVLYRVVKNRMPFLDPPAMLVLGAMLVVHLLAMSALRTIDWS